MKLFGYDISKKEVTAEHHYHERVIENEKVIKEYVESEKTHEDKSKYYEYLNKKWSEVDND